MTFFAPRALQSLLVAGVTSWVGKASEPVAAMLPDECYSVFANMAYNNLVQGFPNNPDSHAYGYAFCTLCTNGTMSCDANVYGGRTKLIASHIHMATDGDGKNGSGPPVLNFCGSNAAGLINDGTMYLEECPEYMNGAALIANMTGNFVTGNNAGWTLAERVRDIGTRPQSYYLNFHSIASWTHWQLENKGPVGMCRGEMQLSRRLKAVSDIVEREPIHV